MDFSPMHPDVWAETDAERWNFYAHVRAAYEDGRDEQRHRMGNKAEADRKMEDFKKQHANAAF
jgi:hypothetical protein